MPLSFSILGGIMIFVRFILGRRSKMKTLHGSGISTNIIDNNEVSTNTTVQQNVCTKQMTIKTTKTNVSPSSHRNIITCK